MISKHLINYQPKKWVNLVNFSVVDAAKGKKYTDENEVDITHIYSYNKVMSLADRKAIC
jgi:hypothetical protein